MAEQERSNLCTPYRAPGLPREALHGEPVLRRLRKPRRFSVYKQRHNSRFHCALATTGAPVVLLY